MVRLYVAIALAVLPLYAHQNDQAYLVIRFANDSNQFKVGQVIPIELAFNAPANYQFNAKSYDRSGRVETEHYEVTPEGRDPLFAYYHDPFSFGIIGGGLFNILPFGDQPRVLEENLNEWAALDNPGHYSLRVTSGRVSGPRDASERSRPLTSNVLEFDVVEADIPWQRQTLSEAVAALDNPATSKEERAATEQTLRFLDTPESLRELARQLTKPGENQTWNFTAGLLGSRNQDSVLKELESRLTAPDAALTDGYLWLLGKMQFARAHAPLPAFPDKDPARQKEWQTKEANLLAELNDANDSLYQRAAGLLGLKEASAKASTIATLLVGPRGLDQEIHLPAAEIAAAFSLLDEKQQSTIVSVFSSRFTSPLMTKPLEALLDKPRLSGTLRIDALQTLLKVNPQEGRVRILVEIREPHADGLKNLNFLARCLNGLPDKELPELDDFLIERLSHRNNQTRNLDAALIGRYATKAILARVKTLYGSGNDSWDCRATDGFIRYFLRWDYDYGFPIFSTKGNACIEDSLQEITAIKRWPDVQSVFIERLNDADLWQARGAAEILGHWGNSDAKQALLTRLRAFNKTWKTRENDFQFLSSSKEIDSAMALQSQLIQALTNASNWKLTDNENAEVNELTLSAPR